MGQQVRSARLHVLGAVVATATILAIGCTPPPAPPAPTDQPATSAPDATAPDATVPTTVPTAPPGDPLLPEPLDCAQWRYDGVERGALPAEWGKDEPKFTSERDAGSAASPHRLCGQLGAAVDLAWGVETGTADTVIAVLDSGIEWRDTAAMEDLAPTAYLNRAELPTPQGADPAAADPHDVNEDGRFSIADYADDARVSDLNGNGLLDPEDLILSPFSDGTDADGNGYVDDISGWDFVRDDNNPLDQVEYGHGTGEARDSTAAHNGTGAFGMCPGCSHLPVQVGDSFMAEGGRFAAGVLFALDSGADVVQEALGGMTNPPQAQQAVDAAYRRGVPIVASMADEQSQHANMPAAMNHTIPVNSIAESMSLLGDVGPLLTGRRDALAVNGCTNTGGIAWVTVPSDGCSSEATGNSAGMVALIESAARRYGIAPHPDLAAGGLGGPGQNVLSASEVAQLLRATADDIDFSTPNDVDPANESNDDFSQRRFDTVKGWDATSGYGRINSYEAVAAVAEGNIPPEADLTSPKWFSLLPAAGTLNVDGHVAASRSSSYDYRVEWTTGLQTGLHPESDNWRVVASATGQTAPIDGQLAQIDLADIAAALPDGGRGAPTTAEGLPDPDRFTVRIRVVVTDADGRVGTTLRHVSVHDDPDLVTVDSTRPVGSSSPVFADLDNDGADELVVASDDGFVHALRPDGADISGFPVQTPPADFWHSNSPTAQADAIATPGAAVPIGAPAIDDIDGDGTLDIVVVDMDGGVNAWNATGAPLFSVGVDPSFSTEAGTDPWNRAKAGFLGGAALADLDADGDLEVVTAAMDRHVYAWHHDGTAVAGFPVLVVDPDKVAGVDPDTHQVTFTSNAGQLLGGELIATPAVADLDGDGRPEIVVGAQEQYSEDVAVFPPIGLSGTSGNTRLYAISPDGTAATNLNRSDAHPDEQAYLPGWPVKLPMLLAEVLPTIGNGVALQAAIGDVDGDGEPEVVATSVSGQTMVFDADGTSPYLKQLGLPMALGWLGAVGPGGNSLDNGAVLSAFGGPSIGNLGSATGLDVAAPTSGLGRALDTLFTNDQQGDPQINVWSGVDGTIHNGFPRVTADLAFFVTPSIVDVDGDGRNEMVAGNGLQMLEGASGDGSVPAGWPKVTGGWVLGTPGSGDWNGDGRAELAVTRRDGDLLVWQTPTDAAEIGDWPRYGGNGRNDGTGTAIEVTRAVVK